MAIPVQNSEQDVKCDPNYYNNNEVCQCSGYIEPDNRVNETDTDCWEEMKTLRLKYPKNIIIGYVNINSVRNKFEDFSYMVKDKFDILIIAETKLNSSFLNYQFSITGFKTPYRLDISENSGGLLVFIREDIIGKILEGIRIPKDIQVIPLEINIRKTNWLILPIYKKPTQDPRYFVDNISNIVDGFGKSRENVLILGDFNMEAQEKDIAPLLEMHQLYSLHKGPTCFKTTNGRCIDLKLTNKKHSFMKSKFYETGFSDHHHLIYTMFKTAYVKLPPKMIKHRDYSKFNTNSFQQELCKQLQHGNASEYSTLHSITIDVLEKHAPLKTKIVRGNDKEHLNGNIRRAIMKRSRLKKRANKSGTTNDREKYKKQRNKVVKLNREAKRKFYQSLDANSVDNDNKFWKTVKPMFSNGNPMTDKIILIERGRSYQMTR